MKTSDDHYLDFERTVQFDFVRATENAALNAVQWLGRGEKELADAAACDAIRGMFDLIDICGEVVIGEGIKDNAPGIFKGEQLGTWVPGSVHYELALDPIDGTTNIAKGAPNSIACIAAAHPEKGKESSLKDVPSFYMMKLAYGPELARHMRLSAVAPLTLDGPVEETIQTVARVLDKRVQDVVVLIMDRPRHEALVKEIRKTGAALRMVGDGDIAAAIAPSIPESGIDLYLGVGGSPEAVLAAAALKCLGGEILTKMWPRDDAERRELVTAGHESELTKVFSADDLAHGNHVIFCATGISDSPMLRGVRIRKHTVITHSLIMRAHTHSLRYIETHHDLRTKMVRLRSTRQDHGI